MFEHLIYGMYIGCALMPLYTWLLIKNPKGAKTFEYYTFRVYIDILMAVLVFLLSFGIVGYIKNKEKLHEQGKTNRNS